MHSKKHKSQMSIIEFQKKYDTEDKCREELFKMRYPKGFKCSKCECTEYYYLKSRGKYQCKNCKHQSSVTSGTVMDRSHLKLTVWLWAIYLFSNDKRGSSACYISQVLRLPYKTAWFVLQRLRYAMAERENKYMLSGTVELDDTYVGAPTKGKKRGRGTEKMKVITALSKDENGKPQYLKMECLENLKGVTIGKYANNHIVEGSTIESDACRAYLKPLAQKYMHVYSIFDANSTDLIWLHTMISNAKSFIQGTYHGMEKKHINLYLAEFCFRFNRRHFHEMLYQRLMIAALAAPVCRYSKLVNSLADSK